MRRQSCIHTLVQILILAALPLTVSQAGSDPFWNTNPYAWSAHSVTSNGRVRVTITKQKPKLYLARTQRPVIQLSLDDDNTDYYDELPDVQVGYRRPELIDQATDVDLTDQIKLRLALARIKALAKYQEIWG